MAIARDHVVYRGISQTGDKEMYVSNVNRWATICLGLIAALALQAAPPRDGAPPGGEEAQAVQQQQATELTGKIRAVDVDGKSFMIEGSDQQILVTAKTKFGAGLSFATLKTGDEVRVVGAAGSGGKFEAREVHRRAGETQS
jgi:hypothetical protein